jgi:hypothetical protein
VAAQHFLPAVLTISECRVKKFAILERASYHNQMDVPVYGSDLRMGNGTTVKLSVAKPTDSEKYSHRWEAQAGIIVLRESKKLSVANSARETPVSPLTDRLTNLLSDAVHSGNFDGHHPAQLRLLLDTLKHSTNTLSNRLHHMAQKYQVRMLAITRAETRDEELAAALLATENILTDAVRCRFQPSTPSSELPLCVFHLRRNPFLNGIVTFRLLYLVRILVSKFEVQAPDLLYSIHFCNILCSVGGSQQIWKEAEHMIKQFGCRKNFRCSTRPSTWPDILYSLRAAKQHWMNKSFLDPSELMELTYTHLSNGSPEALKKVQKCIIQHLEEAQDTETKDSLSDILTTHSTTPSHSDVPSDEKTGVEVCAHVQILLGTADNNDSTVDTEKEPEQFSDDSIIPAQPETSGKKKTKSHRASHDPSPSTQITTLSNMISREELDWYMPYLGLRSHICPAILQMVKTTLLKHSSKAHLNYAQANTYKYMEHLFEQLARDQVHEDMVYAFLKGKLDPLFAAMTGDAIKEAEELSGVKCEV